MFLTKVYTNSSIQSENNKDMSIVLGLISRGRIFIQTIVKERYAQIIVRDFCPFFDHQKGGERQGAVIVALHAGRIHFDTGKAATTFTIRFHSDKADHKDQLQNYMIIKLFCSDS